MNLKRLRAAIRLHLFSKSEQESQKRIDLRSCQTNACQDCQTNERKREKQQKKLEQKINDMFVCVSLFNIYNDLALTQTHTHPSMYFKLHKSL